MCPLYVAHAVLYRYWYEPRRTPPIPKALSGTSPSYLRHLDTSPRPLGDYKPRCNNCSRSVSSRDKKYGPIDIYRVHTLTHWMSPVLRRWMMLGITPSWRGGAVEQGSVEEGRGEQQARVMECRATYRGGRARRESWLCNVGVVVVRRRHRRSDSAQCIYARIVYQTFLKLSCSRVERYWDRGRRSGNTQCTALTNYP